LSNKLRSKKNVPVVTGVLDTVLLETELIEHHFSIDTVKNIKILNDFLASFPEVLEKLRQFKAGYS